MRPAQESDTPSRRKWSLHSECRALVLDLVLSQKELNINPNPQGHGLSLNITDTDNSLDFELAMEVAPFFRISDSEARKILNKVSSTVAKWQRYALGAGIGHAEQDEMESAFRLLRH